MDDSLSRRLAALRRKHSEEQLQKRLQAEREKQEAEERRIQRERERERGRRSGGGLAGLMVGMGGVGAGGKSPATIALSRALAGMGGGGVGVVGVGEEDTGVGVGLVEAGGGKGNLNGNGKAKGKGKGYVDPRVLSAGDGGEDVRKREVEVERIEAGQNVAVQHHEAGSPGQAEEVVVAVHEGTSSQSVEVRQQPSPTPSPSLRPSPQQQQPHSQQHPEPKVRGEDPQAGDPDELDLDDEMEYILDHDPDDGIPAWLDPTYSYEYITDNPEDNDDGGDVGDIGDYDLEIVDDDNDYSGDGGIGAGEGGGGDLSIYGFEQIPDLPDLPLPSPRTLEGDRRATTTTTNTIDYIVQQQMGADTPTPTQPQFQSQSQGIITPPQYTSAGDQAPQHQQDQYQPPPTPQPPSRPLVQPPQEEPTAEDLMEQRFLALASGLRIQRNVGTGASASASVEASQPDSFDEDLDLQQRFRRVNEGRHVARSSTGGVLGGSSTVGDEWDIDDWVRRDATVPGDDAGVGDLTDLMESLLSSHFAPTSAQEYPSTSDGGNGGESTHTQNILWGDILLEEGGGGDILSQWIGESHKGHSMSKADEEEIEKLLRDANLQLPPPVVPLEERLELGGGVLVVSEGEEGGEDEEEGSEEGSEDGDEKMGEGDLEKELEREVEEVVRKAVEEVVGEQKEGRNDGVSEGQKADKVATVTDQYEGDVEMEDAGPENAEEEEKSLEKADEGNPKVVEAEKATGMDNNTPMAENTTTTTTTTTEETDDKPQANTSVEEKPITISDNTRPPSQLTAHATSPEQTVILDPPTKPADGKGQSKGDEEADDDCEEIPRQTPDQELDRLAEELVRDIAASELLHHQRKGQGNGSGAEAEAGVGYSVARVGLEDVEEGEVEGKGKGKVDVFGDVQESSDDIIRRVRDELAVEAMERARRGDGRGSDDDDDDDGGDEDGNGVDEADAAKQALLASLPAVVTSSTTLGGPIGTPPPPYESSVSNPPTNPVDTDETSLHTRLTALSLFPAVPTSAPSSSTSSSQPKKMSPDEFRRFREEEEADHWCCICNEDAEYRCDGCEGDLFCEKCLFEGHTGRDAGMGMARHRWTRYVRPRRVLAG